MPQHVAAVRRPVAGIDPVVGAAEGFFVKKYVVYGRGHALAPRPSGTERPVRRVKPVAGTAHPVQLPALLFGDAPAFCIPDADRTPQGRVAGPHLFHVLDDEALQLQIPRGGQIGAAAIYVAVDLHHRLATRRTDDLVHKERVSDVNRIYTAPEHLPDLDYPRLAFAVVREIRAAVVRQGIYFHRGRTLGVGVERRAVAEYHLVVGQPFGARLLHRAVPEEFDAGSAGLEAAILGFDLPHEVLVVRGLDLDVGILEADLPEGVRVGIEALQVDGLAVGVEPPLQEIDVAQHRKAVVENPAPGTVERGVLGKPLPGALYRVARQVALEKHIAFKLELHVRNQRQGAENAQVAIYRSLEHGVSRGAKPLHGAAVEVVAVGHHDPAGRAEGVGVKDDVVAGSGHTGTARAAALQRPVGRIAPEPGVADPVQAVGGLGANRPAAVVAEIGGVGCFKVRAAPAVDVAQG